MTNPHDSSKAAARDPDPRLDRIVHRAAHMQVLSDLYHGVVHDLKSPLNTLVVNLELLKTSISDEPEVERQRRYVEILHEELMRLNQAVERLLPAAGPPRDEEGRFDLRDLVEEVVSLVSTSARHQSIKIELAASDRGAPLEGRRDRLKQALLCVLANALEAMPRGGTLALDLQVRGGEAVVSVTDTGAGVPEEARERIYELHYSTKEGHDGLGLYVARSVVESTNGSIRHSPGPEGGSRFALTLPLAI